MKLKLSTSPQQVIGTLVREWPMASEAYIRYQGGRQAYDRKQDEFLQTALRTEKGSVHDDFYWVSSDGNMWCVFEHTIYDDGYVHTCHYAFCYWTTAPYAGIFFKINQSAGDGKEAKPGYICYDSHFFERLSERGIYPWEGMKTLIRFVADNHANTVYCTDPESNKWDIRIGHAIGRGFRHNDCPTAYYIKTVLDDGQLTRSQRKDTSLGRRTGDSVNKYISLPIDDMYQRLQAKMAAAISSGKTEGLRNEQIRDIAHILHISQDSAQALNDTYELIFGIIIEIKPSVFSSAYSALPIKCFGQAVEFMRRWNDCQPDDGGKRDLVNGILAVSEQLDLRISKGAVIRVIHDRIARAAEQIE